MSKHDDDVLTEARKRFRLVSDYESQARTRFTEDLKFALASPDNPEWQWHRAYIDQRTRQNKPTLLINKTRQHVLQIQNENRQSPPEVKIRPVGDGATVKAADVFEGIIRHIMSKSNGQQAFDTASWYQICCGIGYWRIVTDYVNDNSFDQEIKIVRIPNPLNVLLDPEIQQFNGEDARYAFIFKDMPRDQFEQEYPKYKDRVANTTTFHDDENWVNEDNIRVAEYYRKVSTNDRLHLLDDGSLVKRSEVRAASRAMAEQLGQDADAPSLLDDLDARTVNARDVTTNEIEWYLIAGNEVIDRGIHPGKYIPVVRLIGEETNVDGIMDRYGHVRHTKDSQRIYNYMSSSLTEQIGLQTKVPFMAPLAAVEEHMDMWASANTVNHAILTYNHVDDAGKELPPPQRVEPPVVASAYLEALKLASEELQAITGQYEASFGMPSNERSGKAIDARNRIAGTASYHYVAHLAEAIRYTGKIIIDLVPKIYDTQQVMKIMGEDGKLNQVLLDPNAPNAHQEVPPNTDLDDTDENDVQMIFNPNVGEYSVIADIGPSFQTKRMELFNAMTQILSQNESLTPIIGDLLFRASDFEGAEAVADRLKAMVPKQALGQSDPQVEQLQQQLQTQGQLLAQLSQKLHDSEIKNTNASMQKDIDWYEAETKRMEVATKVDPEAMRPLIRQLLSEVLGMPVNHLIAAHAMEDAQRMQATSQINPQQPGQQNTPPQPMNGVAQQ